MSILRADSIRDRAGTGAPDFPNGATVTGVVTATSFSGNITGNVTGNADTATSATSATSATNAQGLTGTPNITVGTVTGTDATFSGNLTVNGTTTTIDTAVTAVDSLAVDGSVGIGDTTPENALTIKNIGSFDGDANSFYLGSNFTGTGQNFTGTGKHAQRFFFNNASSNGYLRYENTGVTGTAGNAITWQERLRITSGGTAIFKGGLAEKYNSISGNLASNTNHSIFNGNVIAFAVGDTGTSLTINFTDVHATLSQYEFCSFTVILTPGGAGKITTVQIDGQSPAGGLKWSGAAAPTAGASGYDVYTFALQKYGTGADNYVVYGAATNYD